jgi:hypothetical protein
MTTIIKKTIGVGRNYTSLASFQTWLATQKLKTDDLIVIGEVYDNLSSTSVNLYPADHDVKNNSVISPALGMSVNELQPNNPFYYGTAGIELNIVVGSAIKPRPGVILEGFRINITGAAADDTTTGYAIWLGKYTLAMLRLPEVRFCRIRTSQTGAMTRVFSTGEYAVGGIMRDNLIIHTAGNAVSASLNYGSIFERNTIIRTGGAEGYSGTTGYDSVLRDNVFVGCGNTPAIGLPTGTTTKIIANNITDTPMNVTHPGFTVVPKGELIEDALTDARPKLTSLAIGKASSAGIRTRDMLGSYRGNYPDIGTYQRVVQPLPVLATANITSQVVTEQNITIKGTIVGETTSATAWLTQGGVQVPNVSATPVVTGNTFEVTFKYLAAGQYDAPVIQFSNDTGTGPSATSGQIFSISQAIMPTGSILKHYVIGRKVIVTGSVTNAPETGTITLKPAIPANGAIQQGPVPIVVQGNKFTAVLKNVPFGDYLAPEIMLTNMAGTSVPIGGGVAVKVDLFAPPATPGLNYQTIGQGYMHPTWKEFVTWIRARNFKDNGEMVYAYVMEDQVIGSKEYLRLEPLSGGFTIDNYCIISPPPGGSVNDIHKTDPFDYGEFGVEIMVAGDGQINIAPGARMTGFRITVEDVAGQTDKSVISLARLQSATSSVNPGHFYNNRVRSKLSGSTNAIVAVGTSYPTPCFAYDNYFEHVAGDAMTFSLSAGTFERNTVVRRGSAIGGNGAKVYKAPGADATAVWVVRDNVFTGTSATPVNVVSPAVLVASNNVVNAPMTVPLSGFTVAGELDVVENLLTDARPKASGALIGTASTNAKTTNDIRGENRGPAPDIGAWQRTPFQPTPVGKITSMVLDGSTLIVTGTVQYAPTSGRAWVAADSLTPDGAIALPEKAITITGNTFQVSWDNVAAGNYNSPQLRFTNVGGEGLVATGGTFFSVLSFGGNPMAQDAGSVTVNPKVAITGFVQNGMAYTLDGTFDLMGDSVGKLELYLDPLPNGVSVGPIALTGTNGNWHYEGVSTLYSATVRVVATAFGNPQVATTSLTVIKASGTPALPRK